MKTKKLSFEDFKENRLERKQIVTILGRGAGSPNLGEYIDPKDPIGPHEGGTGTNDGAGIVKPKP